MLATLKLLFWGKTHSYLSGKWWDCTPCLGQHFHWNHITLLSREKAFRDGQGFHPEYHTEILDIFVNLHFHRFFFFFFFNQCFSYINLFIVRGIESASSPIWIAKLYYDETNNLVEINTELWFSAIITCPAQPPFVQLLHQWNLEHPWRASTVKLNSLSEKTQNQRYQKSSSIPAKPFSELS